MKALKTLRDKAKRAWFRFSVKMPETAFRLKIAVEGVPLMTALATAVVGGAALAGLMPTLPLWGALAIGVGFGSAGSLLTGAVGALPMAAFEAVHLKRHGDKKERWTNTAGQTVEGTHRQRLQLESVQQQINRVVHAHRKNPVLPDDARKQIAETVALAEEFKKAVEIRHEGDRGACRDAYHFLAVHKSSPAQIF